MNKAELRIAEQWAQIALVMDPPDAAEARLLVSGGIAWSVLGDRPSFPKRVYSLLFLTDRTYHTMTNDPPFGSPVKPAITTVRIDDVSRMAFTDDGLYFANATSGYDLLDVLPNSVGREWLLTLRDLWQHATGKKVEGNWSTWEAPMRDRSRLRTKLAFSRRGRR